MKKPVVASNLQTEETGDMQAKVRTTGKNRKGDGDANKGRHTSARRGPTGMVPPEPLGNILERISDGFVAFDTGMNYTYVNQKGGEILGRKPEDLVGKNYWEEYPEARGTAFANAYVRALEAQEPTVLEEYYPPFRRWFENRIYPSSDGLAIFFTDVTERRQAEENLSKVEFKYRTLVEQIPPIVYTTGRDQHIGVNYISPRIEALGFTQKEWVADSELWFRQIHPDDQAMVVEEIERVKSSGEPFKAEYRLRTRDGIVRWLLDEVMDVVDSDGNVLFRQGFMLDITERKQAEEDLRLSRDRLADLSRRLVKTHESEQRAVGRELHDQIGQILTALKLTLEIALQLPPELREKKYAQAQELVDDLLARVNSLSLELRPPMLDDLGLLPALLWQVNRFQEQSGIEVIFRHSGVEGERFSAEIETTAYRVAQEALTNVARHAHATRVRLEIHARGGMLDIQIEDNGQGFDPQAAMAERRSSGLSGIRERASLLGGTFRIESEAGKGTRKFIHLPLGQKSA